MRAQGKRGSLVPHAVLVSVFFLCSLPVFAGGTSDKKTLSPEEGNEVVVWTYDSFASEWGPGTPVAEAFTAETGLSVRFVTQGDGGALLSRIIAEGANADADIVLGLDQNLQPKAIYSDLFAAYKPKGVENIAPELVMDPQFRLIPYDYGYFALIYDSKRLPAPPKSLEDLAKKEYERKIILMDPRTSTPGLGFFIWTKAVYGDNWKDYWKRLAPSILTVADGWDTGYGMFTSGEAPLVLSYTTSPAYHLEYEQTERYKAAMFDQGHPVQIEGAGLLKNARRPNNAKRFLDFMVSESFQKIIPLTNWMYPVTDIPLPESFRLAPKASRILDAQAPTDRELNEWANVVGGR